MNLSELQIFFIKNFFSKSFFVFLIEISLSGPIRARERASFGEFTSRTSERNRELGTTCCWFSASQFGAEIHHWNSAIGRWKKEFTNGERQIGRNFRHKIKESSITLWISTVRRQIVVCEGIGSFEGSWKTFEGRIDGKVRKLKCSNYHLMEFLTVIVVLLFCFGA